MLLLALTHLDGKVASIHPIFHVVITSPNRTHVPFLQLSPAQLVQLRADCRFGLEDHHQIPQMVCLEWIHNVLIRERVESGDSKCLWNIPRHEEFVSNVAAVGIGQYSHEFLKPLLSLANNFLEKADTASFTQQTEPHSLQLRAVIRSLRHILTKVPLTRARAFLCLRLLQRSLLELDALTEIQELLPYFNSVLPLPDTPIPISRAVVGGWTSDILIAETMQKLSIPVWVIRGAEQLEKFVVKALQPFPQSAAFVNIAPAPIPFPNVFDGRQADPSKYRAILDFTRSNSILLSIVAPSSISTTSSERQVPAIPLPSTSLAPATGVQRQIKKSHQSN